MVTFEPLWFFVVINLDYLKRCGVQQKMQLQYFQYKVHVKIIYVVFFFVISFTYLFSFLLQIA